ncbi:pIN domain family protein [Mycobacterium kansasii]|uniref:PIN domain family protein n=1 Tax=Mycobacterium kansasii TaxID=1768 RepID=A0A1V3XU99_MYCKA|nr:pIN domain family protein [Mycobacterium kansasii]
MLLYAVDESSAHNVAAASWLEEVLAGDSRVGLPWQTIGAFLRIATHPRVAENPLSGPPLGDT